MRREDLPEKINSPITGETLFLQEKEQHNDEELSVAQFYDCSTEWFDDVVMYKNKKEAIYVSVKR